MLVFTQRNFDTQLLSLLRSVPITKNDDNNGNGDGNEEDAGV